MGELPGCIALLSLDALVLDTETTGLDAATARLVQLGIVRLEAGELVLEPEFDLLVDPERPIPPQSTAIHGIDDAMVAEAPRFVDLAPDLLSLLDGALVIGHNIGFDLAILKHELDRAGREFRRPRTLDTLLLARIAYPTLANYDLETLAAQLGLDVKDRHTAIGDARTTAAIFRALVPKLRTGGIRTLAEAERASCNFSGVMLRAQEQGWLEPVLPPAEALPATARIDSFPYRHRVRDVMSAPPITVAATATLGEAASVLTERSVSSVIVAPDAAGDPTGILTERDFLRTLVRHRGENLSDRAASLMSAPLQTVPENAFVYQALGRMKALGFRHLGVANARGELVGVLTSGDLLRQRASDAIVLGEELEAVRDVPALARVWSRLPQVAASLMAEGVSPLQISHVISEELRTLTRRAAELGERRLETAGRGLPPVPYNVLVLGSGGRGESLLHPDQDNAIVFDGNETGEEQHYFEALGDHIAEILNEVGVPYCRGGVMAKNAEWRHSIKGWKDVIGGWLRRGDSRDVNYVDIFYDFRQVLGPDEPARIVQDHAYAQARRAPGFLKILAAMATDYRAPLGLLGRIKTEGDRVNLKSRGLLPITGGARVLAMRNGIQTHSTHDRLEAARSQKLANSGDLTDVMAAHETLMEFILRQQLEDIEAGVPPSTKVDIASLAKPDYARLRDALRQVEVMNTIVGDPQAFG